MSIDTVPVLLLFAGMFLFVMVSIEAGYQLGRIAHKRSEDEKESPVSAIAGSILGLLAFMLAFSFGIVTNRFDDRKALVREEANAIRTTYLRADFMAEPDRSETRKLLREYLNDRIVAAQSYDIVQVQQVLTDSERIQHQLWDMAVVNARKDMNSDVAALYIDSLNNVIDVHSLRVSVGLQQRIPASIWIVLCSLTCFGMAAVGYQTGIAGSRRSWARPVLAISFSMVIALILALDRPQSGYIAVSQQPLINLQNSMASGDGVKPAR
jgi:hypothetical protein